ncbi:MAG: hypothetical protein IPO62_04760 [Saprospiraceae bacterium]|nr:hypothetical protein [Saprospiraceae bacterium]
MKQDIPKTKQHWIVLRLPWTLIFSPTNGKLRVFKTRGIRSIGQLKITNIEFADFVKSNTRLRVQGSDDQDINLAVRNLFNELVAQKCLQYEEARLEEKYPEFKSLMREYREGILLFEATKNVVWDRASEDTLGLRLFYEKNKSKYK